MQNIIKLTKFLKKRIQKNHQKYFKYKILKSKKNQKYKSFFRVTNKFDNNILIKEGGKRIFGYSRKSMKNKPLITIITVVLNDEKDLENTIKSVLLQKYDNIEFIIIDGGSNGNVISKIKKFENYIDYWISQKDLGIWDAYNKGIKLSSGDFICFLNVGDFFTEQAINVVYKKIVFDEKIDIVFGTVLKKKVFTGYYPKKLIFNLNIFPSFVSTFINKKIYEKFGLLDLKYKYLSDYEYIYRLNNLKKLNWRQTSKNEIVTVFDLNGFSSKLGVGNKFVEEAKIRMKYENNLLVIIKIFIKLIRYYYIKIFNKEKFLKYNLD
tara:strand:- start:1934 stop:2899 length:966 start_codon:yes stop_codon:yes gene_type:complete